MDAEKQINQKAKMHVNLLSKKGSIQRNSGGTKWSWV
jgi:hypothetical protein